MVKNTLKLPFFTHVSKVSDEFFDALHHDGSICRQCHCGRTHFASWDSGFDEGELEKLQASAEKEPDKYIDHISTSISVARIDGKEFVYECPCDGLFRYEQFIWTYREQILDYFIARHKRQLDTLRAFNDKLQEHADALAEVLKVHVPE